MKSISNSPLQKSVFKNKEQVSKKPSQQPQKNSAHNISITANIRSALSKIGGESMGQKAKEHASLLVSILDKFIPEGKQADQGFIDRNFKNVKETIQSFYSDKLYLTGFVLKELKHSKNPKENLVYDAFFGQNFHTEMGTKYNKRQKEYQMAKKELTKPKETPREKEVIRFSKETRVNLKKVVLATFYKDKTTKQLKKYNNPKTTKKINVYINQLKDAFKKDRDLGIMIHVNLKNTSDKYEQLAYKTFFGDKFLKEVIAQGKEQREKFELELQQRSVDTARKNLKHKIIAMRFNKEIDFGKTPIIVKKKFKTQEYLQKEKSFINMLNKHTFMDFDGKGKVVRRRPYIYIDETGKGHRLPNKALDRYILNLKIFMLQVPEIGLEFLSNLKNINISRSINIQRQEWSLKNLFNEKNGRTFYEKILKSMENPKWKKALIECLQLRVTSIQWSKTDMDHTAPDWI